MCLNALLPSCVRCRVTASSRTQLRAAQQTGYLLLELSVTLMLVAMLAIYTRAVTLSEMDDVAAAAAGAYVLAGAAGLETYLLANADNLRQATPIAGVASATRPTMAELQNLLTVNGTPMLPTTFPALSPVGRALQFDIQTLAAAGGGTELHATACLNGPMNWRGRVREDLVTVAMQSMAGRGGRSVSDDEGRTIRGALLAAATLPNPVRNNGTQRPGILCSVNVLSDAFYSSFARQRDARTLQFSGAVNATGVLDASGGALVIPSAGATCNTTGALAWLPSSSSFLPARGDGAHWVATGSLPVSSAGVSCPTAGAMAMTTSGTALLCQINGDGRLFWVDFVSRMGGLVAMESRIVRDGDLVLKPSCNGSIYRAVYMFPMTDVFQTNQAIFRSAQNAAATEYWQIHIVDENNMSLPQVEAVAITYCVYS